MLDGGHRHRITYTFMYDKAMSLYHLVLDVIAERVTSIVGFTR